jgi:hypothetical protein
MRTLSVSAIAVTIALGVAAAACSADDTGTVAVSLTGHGPSGTTYRLRHAEIIVTGAEATRVFHTESDPGRTALSADLPPGSYTLAIPDGWFLDRERPDGTFAAIDAELISANPTPFTITASAATRVTLRFRAGGEEVPLDDGTLEVDLDVEEVDATPPPPPDAAPAPDAAPPGSGPLASGDDMLPGEILTPGTSVQSSNYRFRLRTDGVVELVISPFNLPAWSSGVAGSVLVMQLDGNLVLYTAAGTPVWASETWGHPGAFLRVESSGVFIREGTTVLWQR